MERLVLLYYRRLSLILLRFASVGAVLRSGSSLSGLGRFAYVYEAISAELIATWADPYLTPRWGLNAVHVRTPPSF